jgi:hypothetical protein
LVDRANALLPDRYLQIGPSHFMTPRLNEEWLDKLWRRSVIPYLEEQFFDEPEKVEAFELQRLLGTDTQADDQAEQTTDGQLQTDTAEGMESPGPKPR